MEVGFIRLGQVGAPMALNLLKAGQRVTVYNRTTRAKGRHRPGSLSQHSDRIDSLSTRPEIGRSEEQKGVPCWCKRSFDMLTPVKVPLVISTIPYHWQGDR